LEAITFPGPVSRSLLSFTAACVISGTIAFLWLVSTATPAWPSQQEGSGSPRFLSEANRLLEAEVTLASSPHIYLLVDLPRKVIFVKSRGVELHRLPVVGWRRSGEGSLTGVFYLTARPSVIRPKAGPADEGSPPIIEVSDMPQEYDLVLSQGVIIRIAPPACEEPWLWVKSRLREWWTLVKGAFQIPSEEKTIGPGLRLILSRDAAQSLAWSAADGMAILIVPLPLP
jgi:hypothetical protein